MDVKNCAYCEEVMIDDRPHVCPVCRAELCCADCAYHHEDDCPGDGPAALEGK